MLLTSGSNNIGLELGMRDVDKEPTTADYTVHWATRESHRNGNISLGRWGRCQHGAFSGVGAIVA